MILRTRYPGGYSLCMGDRPGDVTRLPRVNIPRHQLQGYPSAARSRLSWDCLWIPKNPVRIENAGIRSVREIIIVSTMTPFFIALLVLFASHGGFAADVIRFNISD